MQRALELLDAEDWNALSKFPRWSDQPALGGQQPDLMTSTDGKGFERNIFFPKGTAERAAELLVKEDRHGLETEFDMHSQSNAFA
jgi:hypothetical protein